MFFKTSKSVRIAVACFFGAFIGSVIALQLHHLWLIGALLGGVLGYLLYEPVEAAHALGRAIVALWKVAARLGGVKIPVGREGIGFLPWYEKDRWLFLARLNVYALAAGIALLGLYGAIISDRQDTPIVQIGAVGDFLGIVFIACLFYGTSFLVGFLYFSVVTIDALMIDGKLRWCRGMESNKRFLLLNNPVVLPFRLLYFLVVGIINLAKVLKPIGRDFFVAIHKEERLICFVDSAIGAAFGYWFGNALIGGLVGAAFGVVNYEFISVRWLKLVPKTH